MEECTERSNNSIFTFEERGMKLTLINTDRVDSEKIRVDGCVIKGNIQRCDYMHKAKDVERYIELKGKDIQRGYEQIVNTIEILGVDKTTKPKISYIICSRSPVGTTKVTELQRMLRRDYNSDLKVKSRQHKEDY